VYSDSETNYSPAHDNIKSHIQVRIHLRSVSTGHVHPHVIDKVQIIYHDLGLHCTNMDLSVQVSGEFLGILFISQENKLKNAPELAIWNWKLGVLILVSDPIVVESVLPIVLTLSAPDTLQP
jgi:hypothetical protein